jgi:hypothetical protein
VTTGREKCGQVNEPNSEAPVNSHSKSSGDRRSR